MNWLDVAIELAQDSFNAKWKLACIFVDDKGIIAAGVNSVSYGCDDPPFSCHAEEDALEHLHRYLDGPVGEVTAYVARVRRSGTLGVARPCPNCTAQLRAAGIKRVVWTGDEGVPCYGEL